MFVSSVYNIYILINTQLSTTLREWPNLLKQVGHHPSIGSNMESTKDHDRLYAAQIFTRCHGNVTANLTGTTYHLQIIIYTSTSIYINCMRQTTKNLNLIQLSSSKPNMGTLNRLTCYNRYPNCLNTNVTTQIFKLFNTIGLPLSSSISCARLNWTVHLHPCVLPCPCLRNHNPWMSLNSALTRFTVECGVRETVWMPTPRGLRCEQATVVGDPCCGREDLGTCRAPDPLHCYPPGPPNNTSTAIKPSGGALNTRLPTGILMSMVIYGRYRSNFYLYYSMSQAQEKIHMLLFFSLKPPYRCAIPGSWWTKSNSLFTIHNG